MTPEELGAQITQDSKVLAEQFYFFTVVIMWLIHAGFMAYEAGVARRKNVMSTALKNILTIAVVTPAFYYLGWWIYGCMERGFVPTDPDGAYMVAGSFDLSAFCKSTLAYGDNMGPNLQDNISGVFWAAFLLFSWTTASIMSGALIERVRLAAYLLLCTRPRLRRVDPGRRLGLERRRLARHGVGLPRRDRLGGGPRRGRRVHARGAAAARATHRQVLENRAGARLPAAQPPPHAARPDADLHGLLRVLRGVPRDPVDGVPGLGQHLPVAGDALGDHVLDHHRVRGRLHRRLLREPRRPLLGAVGRPRGRDLGVGRAPTSTTRRWST